MKPKKKLTSKDIKHAVFVETYLTCWNATLAYKTAYPNAQDNTARTNGSRMLTNANIQAEIQSRLKAMAMSADEVLARLAQQARASQAPFIKIDGDGFVYFDFSHPEAKENLHLIRKIRSKRERRQIGKGEEAVQWEGETVEVELHDAQRALKLIGSHHRLFAEQMKSELPEEVFDFEAWKETTRARLQAVASLADDEGLIFAEKPRAEQPATQSTLRAQSAYVRGFAKGRRDRGTK